MSEPLIQFIQAMSDPEPEPDPPPVPQLPTAMLTPSLRVASSDACGCGCGRPAGVLVMMPGCAASLDSRAKVDLMIRTLADARDEVWPRRGPASWPGRLAFALWRAWPWG